MYDNLTHISLSTSVNPTPSQLALRQRIAETLGQIGHTKLGNRENNKRSYSDDRHFKDLYKSDIAVFGPCPDEGALTRFISALVALQVKDDHFQPLPVICNLDGSWDNCLNLIEHMARANTVNLDAIPFTIIDRDGELITLPRSSERLATPNHEPSEAEIEKGLSNLKTTVSELVARDRQKGNKMPHTEKAQSFTPPEPITLNPNAQPPEFFVTVFCSASDKVSDEWKAYARELGAFIAQQGWGLVTGLAKVGLMGEIHNAYVKAGGVYAMGSPIPTKTFESEGGCPDGTDFLWRTCVMHHRAERLINPGQVILTMPGGLGSLQEMLFTHIAKNNRNLHAQDGPVIIFNPATQQRTGYWDPALTLLEECLARNERPLESSFQSVPDIEGAKHKLLAAHQSYQAEKANPYSTPRLARALIPIPPEGGLQP